MKKIILNKKLQNKDGLTDYHDIIKNDQRLNTIFNDHRIKAVLRNTLSDKFLHIWQSTAKTLEMKPFAELFIHEIISDKHIGICETADQALDIAILCNKTLMNSKEEILEVDDDIFNILQHLIDTQDEVFSELYKQQWNKMVKELN